jgi:uncharacterized damage-inducible protein DinB/predicted RNase H-like HicB family nuclease
MEIAPGQACMAHVSELPGCWVLASDAAEALARLPTAIERHRAWLQTHGLPGGGEDAIELVVRQTVTGPRPWTPNGASALFSVDRRLFDDMEFSLHLHLLACARSDLLRAVTAIPRGAYDDRLPGERRTVRETLTHLADMEEWFVSRLGRSVQVHEPDPVRRLVDVRARTVEHLARYAPEDRDLVFVPTTRPSDDPDEPWTLRKLLRRLLEHELEHLEDLRRGRSYWSTGTGES